MATEQRSTYMQMTLAASGRQEWLVLPEMASFMELRMRIASMFGLGPRNPWSLLYRDAEGDVVHVTNDAELHEALTHMAQMDTIAFLVQTPATSVLDQWASQLQTFLPQLGQSIQTSALAALNMQDATRDEIQPEEEPPQQPRRPRLDSETESESDDDEYEHNA
ncbi:hypothetical protein AC1031_002947 [Aphanomyces cochlioides]|nr:hypothetical protein AC1031_002947 [Aphanomyces cochlioides]